MISTADSLCRITGDADAGFVLLEIAAVGVFNAISMLLNADET